eukprot:jgi/Chrzof1/14856/Cz09g18180.t1
MHISKCIVHITTMVTGIIIIIRGSEGNTVMAGRIESMVVVTCMDQVPAEQASSIGEWLHQFTSQLLNQLMTLPALVDLPSMPAADVQCLVDLHADAVSLLAGMM